MGMKQWEFDVVRNIVREESAMVLDPEKEYIVESKLLSFVRKEKIDSIGHMVQKLRAGDVQLKDRLVDHMTNNETLFFRDAHVYDALREHVLPYLGELRKTERKLRIWSAAASSGQEIYSIALTIREHQPQLLNWDLKILGTDISDEMLERCREAKYSTLELGRGMPEPLRNRYFEQEGRYLRVNGSVRRMCEFKRLNLTRPWPNLPKMDLIFLRNVLIYFDVATKRDVLRRAARQLAPGGLLALGGGETTITIDDSFERVSHGRAVFYRLASEAPGRGLKKTG